MAEVKLYSYFRSSAAYRVRVALYLKKIPFEYMPVHLVKDGGEHLKAPYKSLNPMAEIPTLCHQSRAISQSMAILQYLDRKWPMPPLFPADPYDHAKVMQICEIVNSGIHPIQNLKVLNEIQHRYFVDQKGKLDWACYWIQKGFKGLEEILQSTAGSFCLNGQLSAADLFLIPQVYNARRFKLDLSPYPHIRRIEANCLALEPFQKAEPSSQPDAP